MVASFLGNVNGDNLMETTMFGSEFEVIDLSIGIESGVPSEPFPPEIEYFDHAEGVRVLCDKLSEDWGCDIEPSHFPNELGLAREEVSLTPHTGTHIDAPWHYGPKAGEKDARTIDEIHVTELMGTATILDFTWKEPRTEITKAEVKSQLESIECTPSTGDFVIIETGADKYWGEPEYLTEFPGLGAESTRYLTEMGVTVIGTDAYGLDKPFDEMARRFSETGDTSELWPAHFVGREVEYFQIEKMANLDELPRRTDIPIIALPIKLERASAGWARPIALVEPG